MTIIDTETVVVFDYDELKEILEGDNTYNYIYFGDDIALAGGIALRASKTDITIDGTYDNVRYTYTDYNSAAASQTIYLNTASNMNITVKNLDVIGRNYYGVICVFSSASLSNVVVNYTGVNYTGPQIGFNPYSSLNITDCNITIQPGYTAANEVAETRNVTLAGTVNINSISTTHGMFWFRNAIGGVEPFIRVAPGAEVTITSTTTYLHYGSTTLNMTFGENSTTNIIIAKSLGITDSYRSNNVLIDNNASVYINQTARDGSHNTWNITGEFRMNSNSSLKMVNNWTGVTGNRCLHFYSGASINFNNPKSVVLYNKASTAIYGANVPFILNISQYNRWTSVAPYDTAGNINDIPTYSWYKLENLNNLAITGTITTTTTNITTNNLTSDELAKLPPLTYFLLNDSNVISMGRPSLTINPITDLSTDISGATTPDADLIISYLGSDHTLTADSNGDFTYPYSPPLSIGTEISFISNLAYSFLYRFRTVEIIYPGDLLIKSATTQVRFSTTPFQFSPTTLCERIGPLSVVVEEGRITPSVWNLYATITHELTNEKGNILTEGLVFVDSIGSMTPLSGTPVLVYTSDGTSTGDITVDWLDNEGILLQLNIVPIVTDTTYRTDINWIIE